jgi:VanZ family protein
MTFLWVWGPALVWMAVTFYISHQSAVSIPMGAPDYVAHGVSYAGLGVMLMRGLAGGRLSAMTWRLVLLATLLGGLYGVSDEFHQSFIPGRHASLSDIVADTVGALVGASVAALAGAWLRRRPLRSSRA